MKKFLTLLVTLAFFCLSMNSANAQVYFAGGNGSAEHPYEIADAMQLAKLAELVNAGNTDYNDKNYILINNMSLSYYKPDYGWTPIGINQSNSFKGNFNGNNKIIFDMKIFQDFEYTGLFGYVHNGTITNLGIEDAVLTNKATKAGCVAGYVEKGIYSATIPVTNCYSTGTIFGYPFDNLFMGGGIVGEIVVLVNNEVVPAISNCYSEVNINCSNEINDNYFRIGGIAGVITGKSIISSCYSTGELACYCFSNSYSMVGGLVGAISSVSSEISNCAALNPSINVGGLVYYGRVFGHKFNNCKLENNIAFSEMLWNNESFEWEHVGLDSIDGGDYSRQDINNDGKLGGRFTSPVWTTENRYLPGLFGNKVKMPPHLQTGDGTQNNPYLIYTAKELKEFADFVNIQNGNTTGKFYKLMNNIDLKDYQAGEGWIPIGDNNNDFQGTFDGNGKIITGLIINNTKYKNAGLFGYLLSATIKNLGIKDASIVNRYSGDSNYTGIVAGASFSCNIYNCYVSGGVNATNANPYKAYLGGISGICGHTALDSGIISNCYSSAWVLALSDVSYTGGVVGFLGIKGEVSNCYSTGNVITKEVGSTNTALGGIVGYGDAGSIKNCAALNYGVAGEQNNFGRIVGYKNSAVSLTNNIAYNLMKNPNNGTNWSNVGYDKKDGADITKQQIHANTILSNMFKSSNGWTTEKGLLPGLFGKPAPMPWYLMLGEGESAEDPILIYKKEHLYILIDIFNRPLPPMPDPNPDLIPKYFKLTDNIDLKEYTNWEPIGISEDLPFTGNFDGGDKKITGLTINSDAYQYAGLFGSVQGGTITNVGLVDVKVFSGFSSMFKADKEVYAGGLAADVRGDSRISNCSVTGSVRTATENRTAYTGGVVGATAERSTVTDCCTRAEVKCYAEEVAVAGSITGYLSESTLANCFSIAEVSTLSEGTAIAGGLVGTTGDRGTKISNCAALNERITCDASVRYFGRVIGRRTTTPRDTLINNIGFEQMINPMDEKRWDNVGLTDIDGASISAQAINADGTLGNRFRSPVWTTQDRYLPGLFGELTEMPIYLKPLGVETITNDGITVYPNPTTGQLRITNYELRIDNVEIYDVMGKKISSHHLITTSSNHLIDISHFTSGIYLLKITTETGAVTKKIIKQ